MPGLAMVVLACGFALGIVTAAAAYPLGVLAAGLTALPLAAASTPQLSSRRFAGAAVALAGVSLLAASAGFWRFSGEMERARQADALVQAFAGPQRIRGLVADDPQPKAHSISLTLSQVLVSTPAGWGALPAGVEVSLPPYPAHEYGEYLQLSGKLQPLAATPASQALARRNVRASMVFPRVSYLANPQANPVLQALFRLRRRLGSTISATLPDPEAATLEAALLGLRTGMSRAEEQALVDTGTVHLIAISGFKLSLLAMALQALALGLLRRSTSSRFAYLLAAGLVLLTIAGYTLLSGATASSIRAAIMAGLVALAALAGRPADRVTALATAVLAILAANPFELWDGGFQLSTLSVLGITLMAEPVAESLRRLPKLFRNVDAGVALVALLRQGSNPLDWLGLLLTEAVATSLAATLFDLPVLANDFHLVSLVSPLANLMGMPLLAPMMVFGGAGSLLGSVFQPLGAPLLWLAWAFTAGLRGVIGLADAVPHAAVAVGEMPLWLAGGYYALLLGATWLFTRPRRQAKPARRASVPGFARWLAPAGIAAGAAVITALATRPAGETRITFLAVQGQATLIRSAAGRSVLIDGGKNGSETSRLLGGVLSPWDRTLNLAIATSSRASDIAGLAELAGRYHFLGLVQPSAANPSLAAQRLRQNVPTVTVPPGIGIDLGGGAILELVDAPDPKAGQADAPIWRLRSGGRSVLFAGHAPAAGWSGLDPVADDVIESMDEPPVGPLWVRPLGSAGSVTEAHQVIDLAEAGSVTLSLNEDGVQIQ